MSVVKVFAHGGSYSFNRDSVSERYFIPEENATVLEQALRSGEKTFRMECMAHKDHSVTVRNIYVDDKTLEEYMRQLVRR